MNRNQVRNGGLLGLGLGLVLLALALFFLVGGFDQPEDVLGLFLPLTGALVCLALGVMALVPLRYGDDPSRSPGIIAWWFRALAVGGVVLTGAGLLRGELPWIAFGSVPMLAAVALFNDSFRVSRRGTPRP